DSGQVVGTATMGWVNESLRKARVVIDRVDVAIKIPGAEIPEAKGEAAATKAQGEWRKAFRDAGWEIILDEHLCAVSGAPANGKWDVGELHNALLQAKHQTDKSEKNIELNRDLSPPATEPEAFDPLDREWCYQLICVPLIEGFDRGVMFDTYGTDSNNVPREGAAVAAQWKFVEDESETGGKPKLEEKIHTEAKSRA